MAAIFADAGIILTYLRVWIVWSELIYRINLYNFTVATK